VAAARLPEATGQRYLLTAEERVPSQDVAVWLQDVCRRTGRGDPGKIFADISFDGGAIKIGDKEADAVERLRKDLGVTLRPAKETLQDMARVLLLQEEETRVEK
jgi:hypothetical protein